MNSDSHHSPSFGGRHFTNSRSLIHKKASLNRPHPLTKNKISSTESNTSGLCYYAVQHKVNFLLTRLENFDLTTKDEQVKLHTGGWFAFRNNVCFIKKKKKWSEKSVVTFQLSIKKNNEKCVYFHDYFPALMNAKVELHFCVISSMFKLQLWLHFNNKAIKHFSQD